MSNEKKPNGALHTLIPIGDFKAVLGVDDREDKISRFCLVTSTLTIEQYCMRQLLRKKHFELIEYTGDLLLTFREYPVQRIFAVYVFGSGVINPHPCGFITSEFALQTPTKALETPPSVAGEILEPEFYEMVPECGTDMDFPFSLSLSPSFKRYRGLTAVKAVYYAGYPTGKTPADLASACMELAAWNMARYRGRKIGTTGIIRGSGRDGEHFELSMPENVKMLLEPYRRKVI